MTEEKKTKASGKKRKSQQLQEGGPIPSPGSDGQEAKQKSKVHHAAGGDVAASGKLGSPDADSAGAPARPAAVRPRGRNYTTSIAIPGSVVGPEISAAISHGSGGASSSPALLAAAAAVARQVAAAAMAACVDEVVVYDDDAAAAASGSGNARSSISAGAFFLAQALQYLETPPYLRKALCPLPPALTAALNALGPMHAPHHLNQSDWLPYREGIVLKSSAPAAGAAHGHSFLDIGMDRMAYVPMHLPTGARVTLSVGEQPTAKFVPEYSETMITAEVVPAISPRVKQGMYWGFTVRLASSLHDVSVGCPYKSGYDLSIGTSASGIEREHADLVLPRYSHLLVVFGGATKGLAAIMEQEQALSDKNPEDYFNLYLNVCPGQGSSSLRTEDALLIALGYLRPALLTYGGNVGQ